MLKQFRIALLVAVLILLLPLASYGATYRVDASSTVTTPDASTGSTWALAYPLLQDALDRAQPGDFVRVAGGNYRPDLDTTGLFLPEHALNDRTESFVLEDGVRIEGGYAGLANPSNPDSRGAHTSILTGDIGTASDTSDNSYHVVTGGDATNETRLNGFTIKLGNGDGTTDSTKRGAGVYLAGSVSPRIENCIVEYCTVDDSTGMGGGLCTESGSLPTITGCTFRHNVASSGGGVAFRAGSGTRIEMDNCFFSFNEANTGGGGGLFTAYPTFLLLCNFGQNSVTATVGNFSGGGGIKAESTQIEVRECNIGHNTVDATAAVAQGGGLFVADADAVIVASNFIANKIISNDSNPDSAQGGGAFTHPGALVYNCIFRENVIEDESQQPTGIGGGLVVNKAAEVVNTLVFDCAASRAGAVWVSNFPATFINCTIARNSAPADCGGILFEPISHSDPGSAVNNCILWSNTGGNTTLEEQQLEVGSTTGKLISYNIIEGRIASGQYDSNDDLPNLDADPEFVDPAEANFHLKRCSPAIDAADSTKLVEDTLDVDDDTETTCNGCNVNNDGEFTPDLDRRLRITDLVSTTDTGVIPTIDCPLVCEIVVDMGAYEYACGICITLGDLNADGNVDGQDVQPFARCVADSDISVYCPCGDLNGDYVVNSADVPCFIELLLTEQTSCPGSCDFCEGSPFSLKDCNGNSIPDANDIADGTSLDCNKNGIPDECDLDEEDPDGNEEVSDDVNSNDIPDECEVDCNGNGIPDAWDISEETSNDLNSNDIPDECETDCNSNDVPDAWDISTSESEDCNENGIPDECEVDCNNNDVPDDCDIADETSLDCNANGEPDECDLARSMLPSFDCNDNDVPDECDIANETSEDTNENGIPDECEEESLIGGGGGGQSMMGGEGASEFDAEAAWAEFFVWYEEQVFGDPGDWHTLTGPEKFERVMAEIQSLGLPYAAPW